MKKEIALLAAIIVLGSIWISHLKAQIDYADTECPVCGSCEIHKLKVSNENKFQ